MDKFRNVNYPYANDDDSFIARGLHLNQIVDEINSWSIGNPVIVAALGATDIVLGPSEDIDAGFVDFKAIFPAFGGPGINPDQVGQIVINNSSEEIYPDLSHTIEYTVHGGDPHSDLTIDVLKVVNDLVLRVTNVSGYELNFLYNLKSMKYVS